MAATGGKHGQALSHRPEFLIAMYGQLMGDINRHIIVVWHMLGVLAASVAALVIAHKEGIPTGYAVLLIIFVSAWVVEHLYDSNYWYNRNLVMITNIERVFLTEDDMDYIHPYFAKHRPESSFLAHIRIQRDYTVVLVLAVLLYFFVREVLPSMDTKRTVDWTKALPFVAAVWFLWRVNDISDFYARKYMEYIRISPGITVDRKIDFGATHGGKKKRLNYWPLRS